MKLLQTIMHLAINAHYMAEAAPAATPELKEPKFCEVEYDLDSKSVSFSFGNGKALALGLDELNAEMQLRTALHGINQKVRDSFAGVKGDYSKGIENAQGVIDQLKEGQWRAARGEGEAKPRIAELAAAIARLKGIDLEVATKAATEASDDKRKEWRAHPRIKATIAAIRAEEAQRALEAATAGGQVADIAL